MKRRKVVTQAAARADLHAAWSLVAANDGSQRANGLRNRIEAFLRSLQHFASIGTPHDDIRPGLRSTGVPGLRKTTILFLVTPTHVFILRIGYLGHDVWTDLLTH